MLPPPPPRIHRPDPNKVIQKLKPINDDVTLVSLNFKREENMFSYGPAEIKVLVRRGFWSNDVEYQVVWAACYGYNVIGYAHDLNTIKHFIRQTKELARE